MTRHPSKLRPLAVTCVLLMASLLVASGGARAADGGREACVPRPASDGMPSDTPDAMSLTLAAGRPAAVANWDVRRWQRHRLWITFAATNAGDAPATLLPDIVLDLRRDGGAPAGEHGIALTVAPQATATQRMAFYVPDDGKTLAARVLAESDAPTVRVALSVECSDGRFDAGEMARPAAVLLDEALTLYFGQGIDPLSDPRAAFELVQLRASGAQDAADVAWAVRALMQSASDVRGSVRLRGEPAPGPTVIAAAAPEAALRSDGTAVLRLRGVAAMNDADATAWARALHARIQALQSHHPRAWIIDLRDHAAASAWPVLAALSPLLEGPAVGADVTRGGRSDWIVERGAARLAGGPPLVDLQLDPEPTFGGPIAVVIGPGTTDGGEGVAVAFEGRPHTRFFGAPTAGFPHEGLHERTLSDGTVLGIVDRRDADRDGTVYRGPIAPDVATRGAGVDDGLPPEAVAWVLDEHVATTARP